MQSAQRLPASWNRSPYWISSPRCSVRVLNAFRHHGIGHGLAGVLRKSFQLVLNAFRHHGIGHSGPSRAIVGLLECSTPSGIMESVTFWGVPFNAEYEECSTPSGIMESVTFRCQCGALPQPGAQRLPASWNRSRQLGRREDLRWQCSTPSGIMESVTRREGHGSGHKNVLNAFRHHGIGHPGAAV